MLKRLLVLGVLLTAPLSAQPRLAQLTIPGPQALTTLERDVLLASFELDPSLASQAGLAEDAARLPSYAPERVQALSVRLKDDLERLRGLDWRSYPLDLQIDYRWIYANAELLLRELEVEKTYLHRPSTWLEPAANNLLSLITFSPQRQDLQAQVLESIPSMLAEIESVCLTPTVRDVETAQGIVKGLLVMCAPTRTGPPRLVKARAQAAAALKAYQARLGALHPASQYQVIGAENYAWRYRRALLLQHTPQELMETARRELARVDARLAQLPKTTPPPPTAEERKLARELTQDSLLALYDRIEVNHRKSLEASGVVSLGPSVGPIRARPTPEAMIPLTGDGGSMNPPPPFGKSDVGYWNVEHFHSDWTPAKRLAQVQQALRYRDNFMGPYSAHEGVPGHHLQLSRVRLNHDPVRTLLPDSCMMEGWALYSEEMFWKSGGLSKSSEAERSMLGSYRVRIKRVIYDAMVETGQWNLQQGADFRHDRPAGKGKIDEDLLRTVQWPTQLICYFVGKQQILKLKEDCRKAWGKDYSDRRFHDELLAVGSIPLALVRAKLLGEPVPDL